MLNSGCFALPLRCAGLERHGQPHQPTFGAHAVPLKATNSVALRCEDVSYTFGGRRRSTRGLADVSFTVGTGRVVGLLGPNGAGKTTLIELISGLRIVRSGSIRLFEEGVPAGHPRTRHRIGFLPQKSVLYEDVSVDDNLRFAADIHGCSRERVVEVLDLVGLGDRRLSIVSTLSGGMQRRVAIARAWSTSQSSSSSTNRLSALIATTVTGFGNTSATFAGPA